MQDKLNEMLDSILSLMLLEGSYEISEDENGFFVGIDTADAGKLIGYNGETLSALQLLINQMLTKDSDQFRRVILDVAGWRQGKEEELKQKALSWANQVKEQGRQIELEPMPSWQRRVIHMVVGDVDGVESESVGEGRDRHLVIKPT